MSSPTCVICGSADPLGLGLCAACGPGPGRDDAVVFVAPERAARARTREVLRDLFGDTIGAATGRVAVGQRPLLRLPRSLAERATTALAGAGVPATAVPSVAAWTRMPWHFFLMVGMVVLTGSLAGARVAPAMMWTTPVFAALLGLAAQEGMRRPALAPRSARGLGTPARTVASVTLADLPAGEARTLLAEVVRHADRLLASQRRPADVDEVVISAAETAREVDLLAHAHASLRDEAAHRCARLHDDGVALLRRALAALGSLSAAGSAEAAAARDQLTDLVHDMEHESRARFAAALEVAQTTQG